MAPAQPRNEVLVTGYRNHGNHHVKFPEVINYPAPARKARRAAHPPDKTYTLGAGIPSSAVPIFQEEGITFLIGGGGGASTFNPNLALPRGRTYWYQQ